MRKINFIYQGHHIVELDAAPIVSAGAFDVFDHANNVGVRCYSAKLPYKVLEGVLFMHKHGINSLMIDGSELRRA